MATAKLGVLKELDIPSHLAKKENLEILNEALGLTLSEVEKRSLCGCV